MSVAAALQHAGLAHLVPNFQGISFQSFKSLLIQDYEKHGVFNMADKQALFKVIKELSAEELSFTLSPENSAISQANSSPDPASRYNPSKNRNTEADILDADDDELDGNDHILDLDDDDDFLQEELEAEAFSQAFMRMNVAPTTFSNPSVNDDDVSSSASAIHCNDARAISNTDSAPSHQHHPAKPLERLQSTAASIARDLDPPFTLSPPSAAAHQPGTASDASHASAAAVLPPSIADPPRIRVIVRKRPLSKKEVERGESDVLECDTANATLYVHEPKVKVDLTKFTECHAFTFDDVFDHDIDNDSVYMRAVRPLIATLFKAGKGTCFAYGQTGSGKTYTMQPLPIRAAMDIFNIISAVPEYAALSLHVACYEIYGGKVFDLLNSRQKLEVREDAKKKVQVVGLKEVEVKSVDVLLKLCDHAACARSTGSTGANDESSRSHSIMTFALRAPTAAVNASAGINRVPRVGAPGSSNAAPALRTIGKLSFIDLAGSERGADTYDNDKQTRLEGAEINKSLLALKECIRALDMQASHIPFRGSKLTSVLRDSFVGKNARTVMIANVSPSSNSCEHTLNTLRYADRVKEIKKDGTASGGGTAPGVAGGAASKNGGAALLQPSSAASSKSTEIAMLLHAMPLPSVPASGQAIAGVGVSLSPRRNTVPMNGGTHNVVGINNRHSVIGATGIPQTTGTAAASPARRTQQRMSMAGALKSSNTTALTKHGKANGSAGKVDASPQKPTMPPVSNQSTGGGVGGGAFDASVMGIHAHPLEHAGSMSDASHSTATTPPSSSNTTTGVGMTATPIINNNNNQISVDPALLAAEEDLIGGHRQHIESTMSIVKEEMELLAQLDDSDGTAISIESYVEELSNILIEKAASISSLQQQVSAFRRQLRNNSAVMNK